MNAGLVYLAIAIVAELVGTSALKASAGFTRLYPNLLVVAGYGIAFFCLSQSLKAIPVGVAYAIWSGLGTAGIAIIGWLIFNEKLTVWSVAGIALIVAGVLLLNLKLSTRH